jgi:prepilin-type N-terminal cleavage/methylation domain-containing protein
MKPGFTIVEIIITMAMMAILLGLGVVGMRSSIANGDDSERKSDVETIARVLEQRYNAGNMQFIPVEGYATLAEPGSYPGEVEFKYGTGSTRSEYNPSTPPAGGSDVLYNAWGLPSSAATTPDNGALKLICNGGAGPQSCAKAEDPTQLNAAFHNGAAWADVYVYEPVDANGNICQSDNNTYDKCVRFNLYWRSEVSGIIQKVRSKHQ